MICFYIERSQEASNAASNITLRGYPRFASTGLSITEPLKSMALHFFLVSFDVRFEKFNHVEALKALIDSKDSTLINYQGKLGFRKAWKYVLWRMLRNKNGPTL